MARKSGAPCRSCGIEYTGTSSCPVCGDSPTKGRPPKDDPKDVRRFKLIQFWVSENELPTLEDNHVESGLRDLSEFLRVSVGLDP